MEFRYRLKSKQATPNGNTDESQPFIQNNLTADADNFLLSISTQNDIENSHPTTSVNMPATKPNDWRKDKFNICLLLFLYLLQGVPLGMAASVPLFIQSYGASWSQQATFSFAFWPFSLKLIWAPIVDALYIKRFGRRKSWLIPVQYGIGIVMIILSFYINDLLSIAKNAENTEWHVYFLTVIFFGLSFLAATQDVCVDGWAISMLSRENVGWASTCNSVGQTAGYFLGNIVFLALESKDFANEYVRKFFNMESQPYGLVRIHSFFLFWGIIFIISTTLVAFFKKETDDVYDPNEPHFGLLKTYKILFKVLCLPSVRSIAVILLTVKIGFAATDSMTGLELIERGVTKESIALMAIPLTPLQIILPFAISRYTTGKKPLNVYINSYPFRLVMGLVMAVFVYTTPLFQTAEHVFPWYFYALAIFIYGIHQIFLYNMFVSQMAFFAQVSDPKIGGTYMTLLNTFANLGSNWVATSVLYAGDYLTWKKCSVGDNRCLTKTDENLCETSGGTCQTIIEAYYIEVVMCTVAGILWLVWKYRTMKRLQNLPKISWQVRKNRRGSELLEENQTIHEY